MHKFELVVFATLIAVLNSSCVSYMALKHNKDRVYKSEISKRGNPPEMIKAYAHGDVIGLGFEVTAMDAIFYDFGTFIKQAGAAVADGLILYGTYEAVDSLNDRSSRSKSSSTRTEGGRDSASIIIDGNGNTVQIRGDQTTFGAPPLLGE
jgi:hypothetical protein